jgi:thiol-disulfide isomerase/thioredoxin
MAWTKSGGTFAAPAIALKVRRAISPMKLPSIIALIVSVALMSGVAGCTPPDKEDKPPVPKVTGAVDGAGAQAMALPTMGPAPRWSVKDLNGAVVSSEQLKGKVVVIDFWATWCPPCIKEVPGYTELMRKYGSDGLVIVGISLDQGGPGVVKTFGERFKVNYPLAMGDDAIVAAFGGVEAIPTTFLIDRQGQIRDRKVGLEATESYEKKILSLL